jgi:hypothetical protein
MYCRSPKLSRKEFRAREPRSGNSSLATGFSRWNMNHLSPLRGLLDSGFVSTG